MNVTLPDELPLHALSLALNNLGLVLLPYQTRDSGLQARWASEVRGPTCDAPNCTAPASIRVGIDGWCAKHAITHTRQEPIT